MGSWHVFAFLWAVVSIKNGMEKKSIGKIFKELSRNDLLLVIWLTFILIITSAYLIGIPILIDRIFNFAVFPVVIMASFGLEYVRSINSEKSIYYNNLYRILVVVLILVEKSSLYAHSVEPLVNNSQIDVAQWFAENRDKSSNVFV